MTASRSVITKCHPSEKVITTCCVIRFAVIIGDVIPQGHRLRRHWPFVPANMHFIPYFDERGPVSVFYTFHYDELISSLLT